MGTVDPDQGQPFRFIAVRLGPRTDRQYCVRARFGDGTGPGRDIVVLVPGATYGYLYWDVPYRPDIYSLARWLNRAGYDTVALDRIGIGGSDRPPAREVTLPVNAFVLHQIVRHLRQRWNRVFLVGHSMGSLISVLEAATYDDVDGVVATGLLHNDDAKDELIHHFYPASEDERFAADPPPEGYLTSRPGARLACFYFRETTEDAILRFDERTKETVTMSELETIELTRLPKVSGAVATQMLTVIGERDITASAEPITTDARLAMAERALYSGARTYDLAIIPATGHNLCLHTTAPMHHAIIIDWLASTW